MDRPLLAALCTILQIFASKATDDSEIRIGAILTLNKDRPNSYSREEIAFHVAINKVNTDAKILPGKRLKGYVEKVDPEEDYDNIYIVNKLLERGISVLIGPTDTVAIPAIAPMTSLAHVPQILPLTSLDTSSFDQKEYGYLLRMSPTEKLKAKVLVDIVQNYRWKKMAILGLRGEEYQEYSQGKNAFRIMASTKEWDITLDRLFPPNNTHKRQIVPWQELHYLKAAHVRIVVVFSPYWAVKELLKKAHKKNLLDEWAWIFSDLGQNDKALLGPSGVVPSYMRGVVGLRSSVGKGASFDDLTRAFNAEMARRNLTAGLSAASGHVYDSVLVAAKGIDATIKQGTKITTDKVSIGFCSQKKSVKKSGKELYLNIKKVMMKGVMSDLSFEENGDPRCASFDVINLQRTGSVKVGEWSTEKHLIIYNTTKVMWMSGTTKPPFDIPNHLRNKTIKVVAVLAPPFVMRKDSSSGVNGTEEYEGLSIDILNQMKEALGFNYQLYLAPDGKFGSKNRSGNWNGVMNEIVSNKAQLSIAPLTISSDGQTDVDFTHPYMTFGIAFVMRVKDVEENYFRFLTPYHSYLWISICVMLVIMGVVLWIFSVFSPFGYYGRYAQHPKKHKVKREVKQTKNTLNLVNAVWSSCLCYLNQGGQQPASLSGKIAVSVFWFAIMIINATYTANLAAHLTVSRMQTPIETVEDLAHQTTIEYGTLMNSQLQNFFLKTDVPRFLVMGQFMEQRKTWMPDIQTAIDKVMNSNFAFISDRPILEFIARQKKYCGKLKVIGGYRDSIYSCRKKKRGKCDRSLIFGNTYGYGFALRLNSPVTNLFNMEIFRLQRDLVIDRLKHQWTYKEPCEMIDKMQEMIGKGRDSQSIQRVRLYDMLGVFIFMAIGIGMGLVFMVMEWIYASIKDTTNKQFHHTFTQAISLRASRICKDIWCKENKQDTDTETTEEDDSDSAKDKERESTLKNWAILRAKENNLIAMRRDNNGSRCDVETSL